MKIDIHNRALDKAIKQVKNSLDLQIKAYEMCKPHYSNPREAEREFLNSVRMLDCIIHWIEKEKI